MNELPNGLHGAHRRSQLVALIGRAAVRSAIANRRLTVFSRTVLVETRRELEFRTRAAAALLSAGWESALTGHSVLALHGCSAADRSPVHVLLPYSSAVRSRPGVVVHHGRASECDAEEVDGLRSQTLDCALAAVLCRAARKSAIACADQALGLHTSDSREEFRAWTEYRIEARSDPRGRRRGRALLDLATGLAESPPESWTLLALVDAGHPVPTPQHPILDIDGNVIYRLDLAWPELRIAVEYDGYAAHEHRKLDDARRDEDLRRRGWTVIRVTADDLLAPGRFLGEVASAFRARGVAA